MLWVGLGFVVVDALVVVRVIVQENLQGWLPWAQKFLGAQNFSLVMEPPGEAEQTAGKEAPQRCLPSLAVAASLTQFPPLAGQADLPP